MFVLKSKTLNYLMSLYFKVTAKRVLLMDEVDGMAGNEDRGGVAELIALLKTTKECSYNVCLFILFLTILNEKTN